MNIANLQQIFNMKNIPYLMLLLLFVSCQVKQEVGYSKDKKSNYTLLPAQSISIPVDTTTANQFDLIQYVEDEKSGFFIVENKLKRELQFYSLEDKRKFKTLRLDSLLDVYGFPNIEGFYYHNKDSIFIFRKYTLSKILLVNEKLDDNHLIETGNTGMSNHTSRTRNPIYFHDNKIYALVIPYIDFSKSEIFNEKVDLEYVIDLETKEEYFLPVDYPDVYKGNSWGISHSIPCRVLTDKNQLVYSFGTSPDVMVYDLESRNYFKKESELYTQYKVDPMNITDPKGNQNLKYFIETDFFSDLFYDKYNEVYYRVLKKGIPYKNAQDEAEMWENKPTTILILDKDFKQIGDYELKPTIDYYVRDMFVGKEGFYISNVHPNNLNIVEDSIKFTLFKLKRDE